MPAVALCLVNVASAFSNFQIHTIGLRKQSLQQLHASSTSDGVEDEAQKLRELASQLRGEVEAFQQEKDDVAAAEQKARDEVMAAKQETRMKYSTEVPILKGDGQTVMERVDFPPRIKDGKSFIMAVQAAQISCWWSDNNERKKKKKRKGREKKEGKEREKKRGEGSTAIFALAWRR